jgi:hypothetical protein
LAELHTELETERRIRQHEREMGVHGGPRTPRSTGAPVGKRQDVAELRYRLGDTEAQVPSAALDYPYGTVGAVRLLRSLAIARIAQYRAVDFCCSYFRSNRSSLQLRARNDEVALLQSALAEQQAMLQDSFGRGGPVQGR